LDNQNIILIACGHFEQSLTGRIENDIERTFHYPVIFRKCNLEISRFYNPGRRQYDANDLLEVVSNSCIPGSFKTMGIFRVDLYIPILTYIFGQAELNGNTGIASLYRLRNELYGLEPDNGQLTERFSKVVIHELGHMFGLIHCKYPVCIMRSSTYVEDLDQKEIRFCQTCQAELDLKMGKG
jgi:archaemetzincin